MDSPPMVATSSRSSSSLSKSSVAPSSRSSSSLADLAAAPRRHLSSPQRDPHAADHDVRDPSPVVPPSAWFAAASFAIADRHPWRRTWRRPRRMARRIPSPRRLRFETETRRGDPPRGTPARFDLSPPSRPCALRRAPPRWRTFRRSILVLVRVRPPVEFRRRRRRSSPAFFLLLLLLLARGSVVAADAFPRLTASSSSSLLTRAFADAPRPRMDADAPTPSSSDGSGGAGSPSMRYRRES